MHTFYNQYKADKFSQNGEDGLVAEIVRRIDLKTGMIVEFGAHNGLFCSNSRSLILQGWSAHLIEGDSGLHRELVGRYKKPSTIDFGKTATGPGINVTVLHKMVTPGNVNEVLPAKVDILSIDVDGIDYWIWEAYKGNPAIVIIEINSSLLPYTNIMGDSRIGTSYAPMVRLGQAKGYFLLCHCGNLVFVRQEYFDKFPELAGQDPIQNMDLFFNTSWLEQK